MKFKKWNIHTPADQDVARLREAGYPYLLSTVLAARGITTAEEAAEFLDRERSLTISPMPIRAKTPSGNSVTVITTTFAVAGRCIHINSA